jgi:very-short-patch-repair endonuclease
LRLLLIRAGFPWPQTQIAIRNDWGWIEAYVDMGWEDIKVGVEYEGGQHQTSRYQYRKDIRRLETVERHYGWILVRVVAEDHPAEVIRRVGEARASRAQPHCENPRPNSQPGLARGKGAV